MTKKILELRDSNNNRYLIIATDAKEAIQKFYNHIEIGLEKGNFESIVQLHDFKIIP